MERTKSSYFALACLCAFAVANIYYNQPLLELFAKDFAVDEKHAGSVAMFVQLSYAAGLVFFVPLGDRFERRKLLIILLGINAAASAAASFTQTIGQLLTVNIVIGMTSVGAQIVIPMVSLIAPAEQRGRAVGTVMSGLMAGVLFGRSCPDLLAIILDGGRCILWLLLWIFFCLLWFPDFYHTVKRRHHRSPIIYC